LFGIIGPPSFLSQRNAVTIGTQTAIVGIASLGMTMIIIAGGIDLSVGSVVALVTVAVAYALKLGASPMVAALAGIATGMICGLLNGSLVTVLGVVPFIITLGTFLIFRGLAEGMANEQKIDADLTWLNDLLSASPFSRNVIRPLSKLHIEFIALLPYGVWVGLLLALLVAGLLRYMRLGRHIFAIGSNEQTARLCGIAVNRVKIVVYSLAGVLVGIAGLMQFSRLSVGDPTVAVGLELDVIAAVVIGGGSLSGGEGSVLGTLIGALLMSTIRSGCSQMGLSNWVQKIVTGGIIIVAVTLDRLRHRRST